MTKRMLGLTVLFFLSVACGTPEDAESIEHVGESGEPLLGAVTFDATTNIGQNQGPCAGAGVSNALTSSEITIIQNWIAAAASRARAIAASPAMAECLETTIEVGNVSYPWASDANAGPFGPYCDAGASDCAADTGDGQDPYSHTILDGLSLTNLRRSQSMRLVNEGQSPFKMTLHCDNERAPYACGGTNEGTPGTTHGGMHFVDREHAIISRGSVETILGNATCFSADPPYDSMFTSTLMWHEALHYHGYDHEMSAGVEVWRKQALGIYNYCMHRIAQVTTGVSGTPALPSSCNSLSCSSGFHKLVTNHVHDSVNPTGCVCVRDPIGGAPRVNQSLFSGGASIAIDSEGRFFRLSGTKVYRRDGSTWTEVHSNAGRIFAGGDRLFVISDGSLLRSNKSQSSWTSLGTLSVSVDRVAVDDFGTFYKINFNGTVWRARLSEAGFSQLQTVNADRMYAGGDQAYARQSGTGNLLRYDFASNTWATIGGPGKGFAVDETGTIYGLAPDGSAIFRYSGATQTWTWVGNAAESILGGRTLLSRNAAGEVYELRPDGNFWFVAGSWAAWAAGGPNLAVQVGSTWRSFTDY